jgi:hypothetical protein
VEPEMKRTSEIEEIRAALKRAAYQAVHGTRAERSGRFLPADKRGSSLLDDQRKRSGASRHKSASARGR